MRLIVAGSRSLLGLREIDLNLIDSMIHSVFEIHDGTKLEIVSGEGGIVDLSAKKFAYMNGYNYTGFPANWEKYGKAAGPKRNRQMAEYGDALLLIWSGDRDRSRGSVNMKAEMMRVGKPIFEVVMKANTYKKAEKRGTIKKSKVK